MASYPVRRGTLHLGMFSEGEVRSLLGLSRLLPTDEVQLPQGWVALGTAFPAAAPVPVATPLVAVGTAVSAGPANHDGLLTVLRCLLGLSIFFTLATFVLDLALVDSLPEALRAWRNQDDDDSPQLAFLLIGAFFALVPLLAWFIGVVAAMCRQKWGAHLMLASSLVTLVINMIEPTVMHGVASSCSDLSLMCDGAALALMYFTDVLAPTP